MDEVSFMDRIRYWLFGGTRTFMGAYREAYESASNRTAARRRKN